MVNDISKKMELEDRGDLIEMTILENEDFRTVKSELDLTYPEALQLARVLIGIVLDDLIPFKDKK